MPFYLVLYSRSNMEILYNFVSLCIVRDRVFVRGNRGQEVNQLLLMMMLLLFLFLLLKLFPMSKVKIIQM